MYICIHTSYTYIICIYTHIYIHICVYIHRYTHMKTHTHTPQGRIRGRCEGRARQRPSTYENRASKAPKALDFAPQPPVAYTVCTSNVESCVCCVFRVDISMHEAWHMCMGPGAYELVMAHICAYAASTCVVYTHVNAF